MGLIDKLKNVFFEEVEEDEEEIEPPKTYAKKVEVPKKKSFFFKDDEDEEEEKVSKKALDNFLEEDNQEEKSDIKISEIEVTKTVPMMFDVDDFYDEENVSFDGDNKKENNKIETFKRENREYSEKNELYSDKKEESYSDDISDKPVYSYSKTTHYEERGTKGFKPSPIISPIYGILDKNYRKEEVVTKRETRVSGMYTKPDLDTVRNKAFAKVEKEEIIKKQEPKKSYNSEKKVYDVNSSKPQVSKVTLADADEYYNDLGLAYNVDYKDASREETRSAKYNTKERKKEKKDVDDNLFDLIDSMYSKED